MRRFRVAHVITRLCQGGAQENTFHTVRLADRGRFEVDLISGPTNGAEGSIEPQVESSGIPILRVPSLTRNPSPFRDYAALRELTRIFRHRKYDIVHTHTSKAGYIGRRAAEKAGVPIRVHTPHGHIFFGYFSAPLTQFFVALERRAAKRTNCLIALTQQGIEEHLARGIGTRDQWRAIGSGIDLSPYEQARARREQTRAALRLNGKTVLFGTVGRLEPIKGVSYFIEAAKRIAEQQPHARFVVIGDGSERKALESAAAPIKDRIQFLGLRRDIPDLMAGLDVLVLPSLNEGMGRVVLEAAAAGTPAIASAVGGVPNIVSHEQTGLLVPPKNAAAIVNAALSLCADEDRRKQYGNAARANVAPQHSLENMVAAIEQEYLRLIREKRLDH